MGKRELLLAKLHRTIAAAQAENRRLEENNQRLHRLLSSEPPKLTPFAELVVTEVKRLEARHFDEWMVTHRFSPERFGLAILHRADGLLNVSALAGEISRYMEYDIRKSIFDAVAKRTGGFAR